MGSIHIGKENDALPQNILSILPKVNIVLTESLLPIDDEFIEKSKLNQFIQETRNSKKKNGAILKTKISSKKYHNLINILNSNGLHVEKIDHISQPFLYLSLSTPPIDDFSYEKGIDYLIYENTYGSKKK